MSDITTATGAQSVDDAGDRLAPPPAKRAKGQGQPINPNAKRKVVLLIAYNGERYAGLQKNPGVTTVEEVLEKALHAAGGISDDNFGTLQKVSWSRAGRTDKGVHAIGQIISVKLILSQEGLVEHVNERLAGTEIRVLGMERASNNFCAHTNCSSREYEYLLPASTLRASSSSSAAAASAGVAPDATASAASDDVCGGSSAPLTEAERSRLLTLFRTFEGTHSFHNFTDGKLSHTDKSAMRFMIKLSVGEPVEIGGVWYVSLLLHGQSFLMHQIRKMVGMLVAVFLGHAPADAIETALREPRVAGIPLAPPCSLTLRCCRYDPYERKRAHHDDGRSSVHFPQCDAAKRAFLVEHVMPHVAERARGGDFVRFTEALRGYRLDDLSTPAERYAAALAKRAGAVVDQEACDVAESAACDSGPSCAAVLGSTRTKTD
jgi:tRNA pseudouridine38-40 synthase